MRQEVPLLAVVKQDGEVQTFPKTTTEQVKQYLEKKYRVRKHYDIAELVANTDPVFLKEVWEELNWNCYKCASETPLECAVICNCNTEPGETQSNKGEEQ